jgi:hypothetical protein
MQKQESLEKTSASINRQTTFLEWDGKQRRLEPFKEESELESDPDDDGNSYEDCYRKNRVE